MMFGSEAAMQIIGNFFITNSTKATVLITEARLYARHWSWHAIPRRFEFPGQLKMCTKNSNISPMVPIPPGDTKLGYADWTARPRFTQPGETFSAKVCVSDQSGHRYCSRRLVFYYR